MVSSNLWRNINQLSCVHLRQAQNFLTTPRISVFIKEYVINAHREYSALSGMTVQEATSSNRKRCHTCPGLPVFVSSVVCTLHSAVYGKLCVDAVDETGQMVLVTTRENHSLEILGLLKFTNYSVQVLAHTQVGDGVASTAIYVRTRNDCMYTYTEHSFIFVY